MDLARILNPQPDPRRTDPRLPPGGDPQSEVKMSTSSIETTCHPKDAVRSFENNSTDTLPSALIAGRNTTRDTVITSRPAKPAAATAPIQGYSPAATSVALSGPDYTTVSDQYKMPPSALRFDSPGLSHSGMLY